MTTTERKNAKRLAVSYHTYLAACDKLDNNGIQVWGGMLLEAQEATGIELLTPFVIQGHIDDAKDAEAAEKAAKNEQALQPAYVGQLFSVTR